MQVFEASLRLLSPFMPFLTEELWHAVYDGNPPAKSIALTRYPSPKRRSVNDAVRVQIEMELRTKTISAFVRSAKGIRAY